MTVSELFDEWVTYEKVVAGDYMHHRRYFGALADHLLKRTGGTTIDLLDLGCGDAVPVIPLLERLPTASYLGIDPSEAALSRARENLAHLRFPVEFLDGTMESVIDDLEGPYDVILASFALHHLSTDKKLQMLQSCRSLLAAGGLVAVVDVFRLEDESREAWLDRWESDARVRFRALDAGELDRLVSHVRENDLPETIAEYQDMGNRAGYARMMSLGVGPEAVNAAVVFERD